MTKPNKFVVLDFEDTSNLVPFILRIFWGLMADGTARADLTV